MRSMLFLAALAFGSTTATAIAQAPPAAVPPPICVAGISKGARVALFNLQTAVVARNAAAIPGLVTAAQALAKTNDDKCFIALMQMKAAAEANDLNGVAAAIAAQQASGAVPAATIAGLYENVGMMQYKAAAYGDASASFERVLQHSPNKASVIVLLAETRVKQRRIADALPLYQKAIAIETAAGRKADEKWYKRPIAVAYAAKSPQLAGLARDWVSAYPTPKNWREAIVLYREVARPDDSASIDLFRLQRANKALSGDADFGRYAQLALDRGFPGEAKGTLEEGFAAAAISRSQPTLKALHDQATAKSAGDRAALDAQARTALAGAQARPVMVLGEAYFGYGDYAKAAELFRAAQGKAGVDPALANLRLGMALAAAGDKAGATTALNLVTGPRAEIARYWLMFAAGR